MNSKEKRILNEFPSALDAAVNKKFGAKTKCETRYDFFGSMTHKSYFVGTGEKKKQIEAFIDGFTQGNLELRKRLTS